MTVIYRGNNLYTGLTADTKPTTNVTTNSWYFDTQLRTLYSYDGAAWNEFAGGSGEANTASNVGAGQGVWKAKTGLDLSFRSLTATSSKIALANNTNDIGIEVTEANLTLSNMTGPLSVAKGGTGATTLTGILKGTGTTAVTAGATIAVNEGGTGATTGVMSGNGHLSAMTARNTLSGITLTTPIINGVRYADVGKVNTDSPDTATATNKIIRVDATSGAIVLNRPTVLTGF